MRDSKEDAENNTGYCCYAGFDLGIDFNCVLDTTNNFTRDDCKHCIKYNVKSKDYCRFWRKTDSV